MVNEVDLLRGLFAQDGGNLKKVMPVDLGLAHEAPTRHMSFTGNPGTGKTTVALKMAGLLHRLGYVRKGQLVSVTRDDLVGRYIGHAGPRPGRCWRRPWGPVVHRRGL